MLLRVALNATPLLSPLTGIGNYIVNLGSALAASGEVDAYSFYGFRWRHEWPTAPRSTSFDGLPRRTRELFKRMVPFKRELRMAQQRYMFARGLRRNAIQLYHEPNYIPIRFDVPVALTVHDLSWLRYPETHPADRIRWLERGLPRALSRASIILVDSEFVRQEVLTTFALPADRVRTVLLGVSSEFRPRTAGETEDILKALDLSHGGYLLTVGTIEPRKNVRHVLAAYAALPSTLRERFPLVIVGARGWRADDLEKDLRLLTERQQIRFLGHVPADALPKIFAGAAAFVFPSLYEGFGLPPLEAMASGVPVLVSNRASLPEVVGNAGLTLDPDDSEATMLTLRALLEDADARSRLAVSGIARAANFTWASCARQTLDAYRFALRG
jgi:glycosyltransferase involved in cell wall biosynthesis